MPRIEAHDGAWLNEGATAKETMSEDDDNRVEYRLSTTGKLVNATPERIEELQRLQADREKLSRPKPLKSFDAILATTQGAESAPDLEAESLARNQARRERAQAMARAGLEPQGAGAPSRAKGAPAQPGRAVPASQNRASSGQMASPSGTRVGAPPRADNAAAVPKTQGEGTQSRAVRPLPRTVVDARAAKVAQDLPTAPPARETTVIRPMPVPKAEPAKGPPPKAPPRAGNSRRTIIKG